MTPKVHILRLIGDSNAIAALCGSDALSLSFADAEQDEAPTCKNCISIRERWAKRAGHV